MNILHRVSLNAASYDQPVEKLRELQVEFEVTPLTASHGIVTFEVCESDVIWSELGPLIAEWGASDIARTEFSRSELDSADHLVLQTRWINGYPMPDDDNGYLDVSFGGSGCKLCGGGRVQNAPFRLRNDPKWGRRILMGINWIPDAMFVPPHIFESVFKQFGARAEAVLRHNTGSCLTSVVQLDIPRLQTDSLALEEPSNTCKVCGLGRYRHQSLGFFPPLNDSESKPDIFLTHETFGEGAVSWNEVIVSQAVYRAMRKYNANAAFFHPLERAGDAT